MDKRHIHRRKIVQILYSNEIQKNNLLVKKNNFVNKILKKKNDIDKIISQYATKFPLDKIPKIDLSILRLAIYELIYEKKNPYKVIIDEAVELAKEFGSQNSYSFINGVLGSFVKSSFVKSINNEKLS